MTNMAQLSGGGLAYFLIARLCIDVMSLEQGSISLVWLPAGAALFLFLHYGARAALPVFLASMAANYPEMAKGQTLQFGILHDAVAAFADTLAAWLAMQMHRRFLPAGMTQAADILPFAIFVCLVPTAVSGMLLAANMAAGGYIAWMEAPTMITALVFGDSLGILLIYQVAIRWDEAKTLSSDDWVWILAALLALAILLSVGFFRLPAVIYFLFPGLVIMAFKTSLFGVTLVSSLSLLSVTASTALGYGAFVGDDPAVVKIELVAFSFSCALTILGIALQNRQLLITEDARRRWKDAAEHDVMTGLTNRRAFMPKLKYEFERARRTWETFSVAVLDVDHFKAINDAHGHAIGDKALEVLAKAMEANCRTIDTPARLGGEEFAILLPATSLDAAFTAMDRLRRDIEASHFTTDAGEDVPLTVSIGVADFKPGDNAEFDVLYRADSALYKAKAAGRNCTILSNGTEK